MKGRRRTFDVDSAPNERERGRPDGADERGAGEWIDEGPVRKAAGDAVRRGSSTSGPSNGSGRNAKRRRERTARRVEGALELDRDRLVQRIGKARADRVVQRLAEATEAFAEERFEEARKTLKPLADLVPDEPTIRELHGLALYRLGRWRQAVVELDAFVDRTGATDQHPVLADCHRALGHHAKVAELWEELGAASPAASIVAEGRIVYAGSLADQGKLAEAIDVLEQGSLGSKRLKDHHLRLRYALGDLYDRAGEHQAARRQFQVVADHAPDFFDVRERLAEL